MALDRAATVKAALELLDEVGLDDLTLRRLAAKLKVQAPALYWHFKNKQELLDEMATAVLRDGARQTGLQLGLPWERWAMRYGKNVRRMLLLHRDGAKMVSGTRLTDPTVYEAMEAAIRKLVESGFSHYLAVVALSTIYSYAVGFCIEEQGPHPSREERAARMDAGKLPLATRAGKHLFANFDRRFEDGLRLIVTGLKQEGR